MALRVADRVKQTTTSTGTGGISLNGSVDGFQDFSQALSDGDTTFYVIEENDQFEIGKLEFSFLLRDYEIRSKNILLENKIKIEQIDGPFNSFKGEWNISKKDNYETLIEFSAEFELPILLNNLLPEKAIDSFCEILLEAFLNRLSKV